MKQQYVKIPVHPGADYDAKIERMARAIFKTEAFDGAGLTEIAVDAHFSATVHKGDCTGAPISCFKCLADECREMARAAWEAATDSG